MIKKIIAITLIFLTSITVNAQTPTRSTMKMCSNGKLAINCAYFDSKSDTKSNTKPSTTTGSNTYGPNLPSTTIGSTTRQRSSIIYNVNSNFRGLGTNGKSPIKSTNSPTNQTQCPKKSVSSIVNSTINTNSNSIIKDKTTAGSRFPTNRNSSALCVNTPTKPTVSLNVASCTKNPKLSLKCKEILEIDTCKKTLSTPPTTRCQTLLKPSDKVANAKSNLAITTARRQFLLCTPKYITTSEANKAKCDNAKKTVQTANSVANSTRANITNNSTLASNKQNTKSNPANLSNNPTQAGVVPQDNQASPANTPNTPTAGSGIFGNLLQRGLDSGLLGSITGRIFGGGNKDQAQSQTQPEPTLGSTPVDSTATQLANTPITPQQQNICVTDPTKCQFDLLKVKEDIKLQESLPKQNIKTSFTFSEVMTCTDTQDKNPKLTSGYGDRTHPVLGVTKFHRGIDISCAGTGRITSPADGKVMWAGDKYDNYGIAVYINYGERILSFNHLEKTSVKTGEQVKAGQVIGYQGDTGMTTARNLHFSVIKKGTDLTSGIYNELNHSDPLLILKM